MYLKIRDMDTFLSFPKKGNRSAFYVHFSIVRSRTEGGGVLFVLFQKFFKGFFFFVAPSFLT